MKDYIIFGIKNIYDLFRSLFYLNLFHSFPKTFVMSYSVLLLRVPYAMYIECVILEQFSYLQSKVIVIPLFVRT